ncbi:hypothetical protein [Occallatibacter riparius]|uniref:Uncharacterized protein n=1 Tax=Occallatibacter riparius TaxID=1002689 RepID=A0A9J7BS01_9BACT|nr:hypothetical protein [Occallatibacter riparius]UWZ85643.1 hypothetical protein MOP44_06785 [Occallatibacter riparius]
MKTWKKILIPTVITLLIGGIYLAFVFHQRSQQGVQHNQPEQQLTADQIAVDRQEFPQHFNDVKDLEGKPVWMRNGYSMPYYPYASGKVEWMKPAGLIPPAQRLDIKKAIKAVAPASVRNNISHGSQQALVVFTLPNEKTQYATPVGVLEGQEEQYFDDLLFFYDDPHTIYAHWPKDVWAAIDAHQVKPGFSELQTRMAIGSKAQYDGQTEGERTADYDVNGKHIKVTFSHDKATKIEGQ